MVAYALGQGIPARSPTDFRNVPGQGATATLDVPTALTIGRGTLRKMRQNLGWAVGYNTIALPIAAGVFAGWGLILRPEMAALSMSGSSLIVAINALLLKRLRLPGATTGGRSAADGENRPESASVGAHTTP